MSKLHLQALLQTVASTTLGHRPPTYCNGAQTTVRLKNKVLGTTTSKSGASAFYTSSSASVPE